jgi:2,3-bisphosphoglycerate-independent phosphoglycerate mutase
MNTISEKVLLIIRDGWGYSDDTEYNMIAQAHTPYTDMLEATYPTTLLSASGVEVGLPDGYYGNSEVGHMTIGAGRVIEQSLLRINRSIMDGSFFRNSEFIQAIQRVQEKGTTLHIVGLLQKQGVHAHFDHLIALLELAQQQGCKKEQVAIHIITDGRDMEMQYAEHYIRDLEYEIQRIGIGHIMSLSGRYYAMDRNRNWNRTEKYYHALMNHHYGSLPKFNDPCSFLKQKYSDRTFSDEFLEPTVSIDYKGLQTGDSIIFYNFRTDRAEQLTKVFMDSGFGHFELQHDDIYFVSMTRYYEGLTQVAFPDITISDTLGQVLEHYQKTQLRISETEKYSHVTFFFDAGTDRDFIGEQKIIIHSPDVPTFDMQPEMSSVEITERLISEIVHTSPDCVVCNFPNADMVGHTGNTQAIISAVESVDVSLQKIIPIALENRYAVIVTGDHGNAEYKKDTFETSHTHNKVPCTIISSNPEYQHAVLSSGMGLKNIAATICDIMAIPKPAIYEQSLYTK